MELEKEHVAVPIGGIMRNVGPSAAFSVRVYAHPEYHGELAIDALRETFHTVVARGGPETSNEDLWHSFVKSYRTSRSYVPMLEVGEDLHFLVVAKFEATDPFVLQLRREEKERQMAEVEPWDCSYRWTLGELQAHQVHAASRTFTKRKLKFAPGDLCAPMESEAELRWWASSAAAGGDSDRET